MKEQLIFELSRPSREGYRYTTCTLPTVEIDSHLKRQSPAHLPQVSELDVVRHFSRLSRMSFSVDYGMYPLGSCTMKYNPKINEATASLEGFQNIHPLQDEESVQGGLHLMHDLLGRLAHITGMQWGSLAPLAGAHGEYVGLKIIRAYHLSRSDTNRNTVIVPISAHGTNPASAALNGFTIREVAVDKRGLVDLEALKELLDESVAAIMLTNPNTLGLFESDIAEIADLVHSVGGLLYYDGANLNAIMGMSRPGDMGFDVIHLNLHKTFSTPHGGGGPGAGPVLVKSHLVPFLPRPDIAKEGEVYHFVWDQELSIGRISQFWGNFAVLVRAYTYILRLGTKGLREASRHAVLNANYLLAHLKEFLDYPYEGYCMHEFVISAQALKHKYQVTALDIAKALLDRSYHPPTIYFPLIVAEAMMFEPTESESIEQLDVFIATMRELVELAKTDPQALKRAPELTPVGRIDEVQAVKNPIVRWHIE